MSNFGVTPVDPNVLLKMLEVQIQDAGTPAGSNKPGAGLGSSGFLSLFTDDIHLADPSAVQFITLRPTNFPTWQSVVSGAGEDNTGFNGIVVVTAFAQMSADPEMKNTNAVSEQVLSATTLIMKAAAALQFWQPKDTDQNDLLRQPARIADSGITFSPVTGRGGPWVKMSFPLELKFTAKLPSLG